MNIRESATPWDSDELMAMAASGMTYSRAGARSHARFAILRDLGLVVVADGSGAAVGGDLAAGLCLAEIVGCFTGPEEPAIPNLRADELTTSLTFAMVRFAIEHAHKYLRHHARESGPAGMTTTVAMLVVAGPRVVIGQAGNMCVYRMRAGTLDPLVSEPDKASSRSPVGGAGASFRPDVRSDVWKSGDVYLMCNVALARLLGRRGLQSTLATCSEGSDDTAALLGRALRVGVADGLVAVTVRPIERSSHAPPRSVPIS